MSEKLLYSDDQYEITTLLEVNGFEHAKNLVEVSFGALQDFAAQNDLSKTEVLARMSQLRTKFDETYKELESTLK